jgi:type IV pilus assembly protein PilZ
MSDIHDPTRLPGLAAIACPASDEGVRREYLLVDKRSHPRVTLDTAVTCELADGSEFSGRSKDISIGGMFVFTTAQVPFGTEVKVRILLPRARQEFVLPGVVRWANPDGVGVQFGLLGARETHAISELLRK